MPRMLCTRDMHQRVRLGLADPCPVLSTLAVAVSSSIDCVLRLWDLETGKQAGEIKAGAGEASRVSPAHASPFNQ